MNNNKSYAGTLASENFSARCRVRGEAECGLLQLEGGYCNQPVTAKIKFLVPFVICMRARARERKTIKCVVQSK